MSFRAVGVGVVASLLLVGAVSCAASSAPGSADSAASRVLVRTTALPGGALQVTRGEGFDGSGAFLAANTCDRATDYSPGLGFANVPVGTLELAVSLVDLDTPKIHWLQLGIPATVTGLRAHMLTDGAREALNDFGEASYDGPCPPAGTTHRYQVTLYALHDAVPGSFGRATPPQQTLRELRQKATATASFTAPYTRH